MTSPGLAFDDLGRSFGARHVLRHLTFAVAEGEAFGLLGANGSGKTTLLEILATLLTPTSGRAFVRGHDVVRDAAAVRGEIGYCPSNGGGFYPRLTGARNLEFFGALAGLDRRRAAMQSGALLERLDLADARDVRVEKYSDGMRARLAIARAFLASPRVLLLDEPSRSLDPDGQRRLAALVDEARRGGAATVLWITHSRDEAFATCDRVGEIVGGAIVERTAVRRTIAAGVGV